MTASARDVWSALADLLTCPCPRCGLPVVGHFRARAHCDDDDDDEAEWRCHQQRRDAEALAFRNHDRGGA